MLDGKLPDNPLEWAIPFNKGTLLWMTEVHVFALTPLGQTVVAEQEARQTIVQCGFRILVLSVTLRNTIYSGAHA